MSYPKKPSLQSEVLLSPFKERILDLKEGESLAFQQAEAEQLSRFRQALYAFLHNQGVKPSKDLEKLPEMLFHIYRNLNQSKLKCCLIGLLRAEELCLAADSFFFLFLRLFFFAGIG